MRDFPNSINSSISSKDHFSLSELAENLLDGPNLGDKEILNLRDWLYQGKEYFFNHGDFYKKSAFFENSFFLLQLTAEEWESGFLIPGHRWHPFVSSRLRPWDIELLDSQGQTIAREERVIEWEKLKPFHLLLGEEQLFSDCQMKSDLFGRFFAQFPQYDFRPILKDKPYSQKNLFKCRVLDYNKGIIQIVDMVEKQNLSSWQKKLEKALEKVFHRKGLTLTLPEQIEWAFFWGDRDLLSNPMNTLAAGIYRNPQLSLYRVGLTTILWKSDGSIDEILRENALVRDPSKLKREGENLLKEMENLFGNLSPFVEQALGSLKSLSLNYIEHYTHCLQDMGETPLKPLEKESQLFLAVSQYSHCLMSYFKEMAQSPPSEEEKEKLAELILETEGLLSQIEPFLKGCTRTTKS